MMRNPPFLLLPLDLNPLRRPRPQNIIIRLILTHHHTRRHIISDRLNLLVELNQFLRGLLLLLLLLLAQAFLLLQQLPRILLRFLLLPNLFLLGVDLGADLCGCVLRLAVVFEVADDFVNDVDVGVAFALGVADLFGVAAALGDEVVAVIWIWVSMEW
jgi:hypothetical protein